MRELKPKLLLKYHEYLDLWTSVIFESLSRCEQAIGLDRESGDPEISMNMLVIFTVFAVNALRVSSKISKTILSQLETDMKEQVIHTVSQADPDLKQTFESLFNYRYKSFNEIMTLRTKDMEAEMIVLSFARLVLDVYTLNDNNEMVLDALNHEFIDTVLRFEKLSKNSGVSVKIIGKPGFVVQKD